MITIYIQAKSKKAINEDLNAGKKITGIEYAFLGATNYHKLNELPTGTVVKVFDKRDGSGTPIAKSYGTWNAKKNKLE